MIRPVDDETLEESLTTLTTAFMDDPLFVWMFPDPGRRFRGLRWLRGISLDYGRRQAYAVQSNDGLAVAVWMPPGRKMGIIDVVRSGFLGAPFRIGPGPLARLTRFNNITDRARRQHASDPHWYLWIIGVAVELQGNGIGAALMADGLAQADRAGVACYLDTVSEANIGFYEGYDFSVVETMTVGSEGPAAWAMRREPRNPDGTALPESAPPTTG